jgi:membrane protein
VSGVYSYCFETFFYMNFRKIGIIKRMEGFLRSIYLWNTTISLYYVLQILWKKIITLDLDQRAAAVSYSLILAIFPGIIFLFTLIPYIPVANLDIQIMEFLKSILPLGIYDTVATTIEEIVSRRRVDILSFGFLFAVYAATNGMMAMMRSFNMTLNEPEPRGFLKARLISFMLTGLLILVMISAVGVLVVGKFVISYIGEIGWFSDNFLVNMIRLTGYFSIFMIFFIGICIIYHFAPALNKRIRFFNAGAFFASILCIFATNLFSYYLGNFNSYNRLYGSIGTLIGLMVWIYLIVLIIILGFEINSSLRDALRGHKMNSGKD